MILFPKAKINIGLNILFKRDDGFHELNTMMYPINLSDIITINPNKTTNNKLHFTSTGINIDGNSSDNLICKAYRLIDKKYNLPPLRIHLHKSIPFGAGLGGGSSDGAFTIKGINQYCNLGMSVTEMEAIAAQLGSDCAFFINNKPAIAKGRGEVLTPFQINLNDYYFALVIPPIPISTKIAYSQVKPFVPNRKIEDLLSQDISEWKNCIVNNFEDSVFVQYPEIRDIKIKLYELGALFASLSGSGSAVFGIFKERISVENIFPKNYFVWQQI